MKTRTTDRRPRADGSTMFVGPVRVAVVAICVTLAACGGDGVGAGSELLRQNGPDTAASAAQAPSAEAVGQPVEPDAALMLALNDPDALARMSALQRAVQADATGALVLEALLDHRVSVRLEAVGLAEDLPKAQATRLLQRALEDSDGLVREQALYELDLIDRAAARQAAEMALMDPDDMVREAAREVLDGPAVRSEDL